MKQTDSTLQQLVDQSPFLTLTDSHTRFPGSAGEGLALLVIDTPLCQATLALNGGQLLSFKPHGAEELLWLSPNCTFSPGSSLRGGIPLCLPWFGPHPTDSSRPKHGIARTRQWSLTDAQLDSDNRCVLSLQLRHPGDEQFEHPFNAVLTLTLDQQLSLQLNLINSGADSFDANWVMHTYYRIDDITQARVEGLDGREYFDKVAAGQYATQSGPVTFTGEVDRVYEDIQLPVTLDNAGRRIRIEGDNCPSVVTWNTGAELAAKIGDIGAGNHTGYVCVERGACLGDTWRLGPGESRRATMNIFR